MLVRQEPVAARADIARAFVDAAVEVLATKCRDALRQEKLTRLVLAGGVGANKQLRAALDSEPCEVFYPEPELCTDNGAMIAYAAALRLGGQSAGARAFDVKPRWELA